MGCLDAGSAATQTGDERMVALIHTAQEVTSLVDGLTLHQEPCLPPLTPLPKYSVSGLLVEP